MLVVNRYLNNILRLHSAIDLQIWSLPSHSHVHCSLVSVGGAGRLPLLYISIMDLSLLWEIQLKLKGLWYVFMPMASWCIDKQLDINFEVPKFRSSPYIIWAFIKLLQTGVVENVVKTNVGHLLVRFIIKNLKNYSFIDSMFHRQSVVYSA